MKESHCDRGTTNWQYRILSWKRRLKVCFLVSKQNREWLICVNNIFEKVSLCWWKKTQSRTIVNSCKYSNVDLCWKYNPNLSIFRREIICMHRREMTCESVNVAVGRPCYLWRESVIIKRLENRQTQDLQHTAVRTCTDLWCWPVYLLSLLLVVKLYMNKTSKYKSRIGLQSWCEWMIKRKSKKIYDYSKHKKA